MTQFSTPMMVHTMNMSTRITDLITTEILYFEPTNTQDLCEIFFEIMSANRRNWLIALYFIYFIFGVFGNAILVYLFLTQKNVRNANNAFVTNLALSDFLFVILYAPMKSFEESIGQRPFGKTFCKITIILNYTSQDVSTMSMAALSYLRFRAVMYPLQVRHGDRNMKWFVTVICVLSWLLGIAAAIYPALDCKETSHYCLRWDRHIVESNSENKSHLKFHILRFVFLYFVPLLIIAIIYTTMAFQLCRKPHTLKRNDSVSARRATRSRKKLGGIVLFIVVIFFLSWLPNYVGWLIFLEDRSFPGWLLTLRSVCMFVPASFNPIILFVTSSGYRKHFLKAFAPRCHSGRHFVRQLRSSSLTTGLSSMRMPQLGKFSRRSSSNLSSP